MRSGEFLGHFTKTDVENPVEVIDSVLPVLSGNFLLCEVRVTILQANYPCTFNESVLNLRA